MTIKAISTNNFTKGSWVITLHDQLSIVPLGHKLVKFHLGCQKLKLNDGIHILEDQENSFL